MPADLEAVGHPGRFNPGGICALDVLAGAGQSVSPSPSVVPAARDTAAALDRRFEGLVFDWVGTAVATGESDAQPLRALLRLLLRRGVHLVIVTGATAQDLDRQLRFRHRGEHGTLTLVTSCGSEAFRVGRHGLRLSSRRLASADEAAALDRAAAATAAALRASGVSVGIVASRGNRRTIELAPPLACSTSRADGHVDGATAVTGRLGARHGVDLGEVMALARSCSVAAGLPDVRISRGAEHIEVGLTDERDASRAAFSALAREGVGPGLVLVAGSEFGPICRAAGVSGRNARLLEVPAARRAVAVSVGVEPHGTPTDVHHVGGGPTAFRAFLADQVVRRDRRELPVIDRDPAWTLVLEGVDARHERANESLLALADGLVGTRAAPLRAHRAERGGVRVAGLYVGHGAEEELIQAPAWRRLPGRMQQGASHERVLDLRTGVLGERIGGRDPVDTIAFSSLRRPGLGVLRVLGGHGLAGPPLAGARRAPVASAWRDDNAGGGVLALATQNRRRALDRFVVFAASPRRRPGVQAARRRLGDAERLGFDRLLCEQRADWGARWHAADIRIEGDDELQHALRVALYHLIGAAGTGVQAAVGARGATGDGYRGHVFWDTDVFVLPFLAATCPASARAIVRYRSERLVAARTAARALGREGARFPWESASSGVDVTPPVGLDRHGNSVPIENGGMEEHIVADVAWGAATYAHWTRDRRMSSTITSILLETARWWASRARVGDDGRSHIERVIGPDEYHVAVDDNAFTNVMARWNLRQASGLANRPESARFEAIAASLVDGYDSDTGRYEQFAGFFDLEALVIADLATRPIAADVLLGRERVAGAQIIKQADVLMLHHLVPEETEPGSLVPNLDFYEPRTAHGSSLSPGVHAALHARAGRLDRALAALSLAARIDLDDLTETTASGVHLAAMASTWQAIVGGICGISARDGELRIDPASPPPFTSLAVPVQVANARVRVMLDQGTVAIESTRRVTVKVGSQLRPYRVPPGGLSLRWSSRGALELAP